MKTTKFNFALALTFVILIITNESFCQLKNFGIKAGLNLSNVNWEVQSENVSAENRTGFNITVFYDALNFKYFILSAESDYTQKGFKEELTVTNELGEKTGTAEINNLLNYIEISAIAKFIVRSKTVQPYIAAGSALGFYTGYSTSYSGDLDSVFSEYDNVLLEELSSASFGIKAGAGMEIQKIIPQTIILEARYNFDLTYSYDQNSVSLKNKLWEFNIGIKF